MSTKKIVWKSEEVEEIKKLYVKDRLSSLKISKLFGVSSPTIQKLLKSECVLRKVGESNIKYSQNNDYFKYINTEEKAYWLGFIYADGYITRSNQLRINLAIKDENHLVKFYKSIESDREVKYTDKTVGENIYYGCYAYVASSDFTKKIINKGCITNKSLILTFPTEDIVPSEFINHFIRGYFDGDGSIHIGRVNTTGYKNYRVSFVGTYQFLTTLKNKLNCNDLKLEDRGTHFSLQIYGNKQVFNVLRNFIYRDANISMDRKYEKYLEFKEMYS